MTTPTATLQTFQAIGNREDLTDAIYQISPTSTPFVTMTSRVTAKGKYHEWQTTALPAAATNALIEGDTFVARTSQTTTRIGNHCQILSDVIGVSRTQEAVNKAGRDSEIAWQLTRSAQKLKRDLEYAAVRNQASTAGAAASARTMASVESWLTTNDTSIGGGAGATTGFSGTTVAAPTDGTQIATFSEALLKSVISQVWQQGGDPRVVMTGPTQKQRASTFTGIATLFRDTGSTAAGTRIVGAADVYVSDFGEHRIVPSRFNRDRTILVLDMDYWAMAWLDGWKKTKLGVVADAEQWAITGEVTLECRNEAANGKIADVLTV